MDHAVEELDLEPRMRARPQVPAGGAFGNDEGKWFTVRIPAEVYLSYFDSDGPAVMPKNAAAIAPGTPVLWIEASGEIYSVLGPNYAFNKIPPHPKSAFVYVVSDHLSAMRNSDKVVIAWLNCL